MEKNEDDISWKDLSPFAQWVVAPMFVVGGFLLLVVVIAILKAIWIAV